MTSISSQDRSTSTTNANQDDDVVLQEMGYVPSFRREFTSLSTISFAFSIMGLCSSIATTFNSPLLFGGPASVTWTWLLGSCMCLTLGASVAEIVSAFPTCGGVYMASAQLCPPRYRAIVGWVVGWLSLLGNIFALSSVEFGLSNMIWAAVVIAKDGDYALSSGKSVGLCTALLVVHGILNCLPTRWLSRLNSSFVFINLGATFLTIIVLLAMTPRSEMHSAAYVFGSQGVINNAQGWNTGVAFLFGLLSVQWTMTGYDCTAHISEEVRRAAYLAPSAIFISVIGTGLIGWILNIALVVCSGPFENLPGPSGSAFLTIMVLRIGKPGALFLWSFICLTAFCVCQSTLQSGSRVLYALSRDHALPDGLFFAHIHRATGTPLRAVWLAMGLSILPGLLDLASPLALNAVYAATAMTYDLSYIVSIALRRVYRNHPDVHFKPGPFYMGDGWFGWAVNITCIVWTLFVSVIFSMPNELPVNPQNMNYASLITIGIILLSMVWYFLGAHHHYHGPASNIQPQDVKPASIIDEVKIVDEKQLFERASDA